MKELNFNMSWENSFNYSNMNLNFSDTHYNRSDFSDTFLVDHILSWVNWITIGIGLPLILIVMIAVFFQVKKGQDAPVFVISLLVSDLIQLCCRIPLDLTKPSEVDVKYMIIVYFGIMVSVGFMVCISYERYLVITKPLWYRFRRNNKRYGVVCIVFWILAVFYVVLVYGIKEYRMADIFFIIILLLPVPFFIFFLVGTIKALSGVRSVPEDEKRRIVAIQVAVLILYSVLYLPIIICLLRFFIDDQFFLILPAVSVVCFFLSPLADTTLYLFIRKSILDKFLASICSCKISNNQEMTSTESRTETNTETV